MNRFRIVQALIVVLLASPAFGAERPNVLWLSIEDASPHLGAYGVEHAVTPHIDRLAAAGVRFDRAYAPAPVCAVARSALITGVYSVALGSQFMRTKIIRPDVIKPFPWYLRRAGYFTSNRHKTDYQFDIPEGVWDFQGPDHADWRERSDPDQPFFSVINFGGTHESKNLNTYDATLFDAAELELPPYYPDTPGTRRAWASYYQNLHAADRWVAENLARLEADGLAEDTIVMFWADHGVGFPRGKRWIYELGLRVPLIVYVPEKWRAEFGLDAAHGVSAELVNFIDFAPTLLSIAGAERPDYMQGRVILGPDKEPAPAVLFAHRDRMDERIDIIRTVIGTRYKYIRNFEYFKPRMQYNETPEIHDYSWISNEIRAAHDAHPDDPVAGWYFEYKPVEELYDLQTDPNELHNLAGDPAYADPLATMRQALIAEQDRIGDLGAIPEGLLLEWRSTYGSEYAIGSRHRGLVDAAWAVLRRLHRLSVDELAGLAQDVNAAVRYWAAIGLGNRAADVAAHPRLAAPLTTLLGDPERTVRIAAARGLLLLGPSPPALNELAQVIGDRSLHWVHHLDAMLALDLAGSRALPIRDVIEAAVFDKKYPRRVRDELMPRIETAPARVPPLPGT
jgi:arylsulfatase A-like enzyme